LTPAPNHIHNARVPSQPRGGSRSPRTRDGMRWTLLVSHGVRRRRGRPSRVVPIPRRWGQVLRRFAKRWWLTGPDTRKSAEQPLTPLRRECRCFGSPVATMLVCFSSSHTRLRVQQNTRHSLRPRPLGDIDCATTRTRQRRGNVELRFTVIASEAKQSRASAKLWIASSLLRKIASQFCRGLLAMTNQSLELAPDVMVNRSHWPWGQPHVVAGLSHAAAIADSGAGGLIRAEMLRKRQQSAGV
jgi:hypothetical protein